MSGITRRRLAAAAAVLLLLGAACGGGGSKGPSTPDVKTAPATVVVSPPSAGTTVAPSASVANEPVAFATDDGVTVRGHFYTTAGPKRKAVVLAHMFPNDQRAWSGFALELASQGIAALTFDFRGFGETGGGQDISKIDRDLEAAVRFVRSRDYAQIYVIGASMGGTAALKVAARQDLAGVVAVSAPVSFMGLSAENDVRDVTEPKLFIAARTDPNGAAASLATLLQAATGTKDSQLYDGSAHGTELLQGANAAPFRQRVIEFLQR